MLWIWDAEKDEINQRKHGFPLSIGEIALADPLAVSLPDDHPEDDRWNTICQVESVVLYIVHTWPDDDSVGRIISIRKASKYERKAYENGEH